MKKFLMLVVTIVIAVLILGCASQKPQELVVIHPTWIGYGPLYIAQEKGFFEKRGLKVENLVVEDLAQNRAMLASGKADIELHTIDMALFDVGVGVPQVFVYKVDESNGADGVISRQSINSLKDLEGKRVACQVGVPAYFFLRLLMEKDGIDKNKVQFLDIGAEEAGAAFFNGDIDAACTWEPWLSKAKESSSGKVLISSSAVPGKIVDVIAVTPASLKSKRPQVKAFVQAWIEAEQYIRSNPDEANSIMANAFSMKKEEFVQLSKGLKWNSLEQNKEFFSGEIYSLSDEINEIAVKDAMITKSIDVNSVIDGSIVSELG